MIIIFSSGVWILFHNTVTDSSEISHLKLEFHAISIPVLFRKNNPPPERKRQIRRLVMDDKTEAELFYAINRDDPDALERLLNEGADPNTVFDGYDPLGKTLFWFPLHFCCEKGRLRCARLLLAAGARPDAGDQWCMTPLMYAVRTEWHNMVELMLASGGVVDLQDTRGRTPLHLAVECSDDM